MKARILMLGLFWGGMLAAWATTPSGLVRQGNEAFALESFDEALDLYQKAEGAKPDSAEIAFNQGAALYRKGNYGGAALRFEEAARRAKDPKLAAKAEYNLGNCRFREAEQAQKQDLKQSIKSTRKSEGHFREALRLNQTHREAAENLEMSRQFLKALLEEQKQQPQEQQNQQGQEGEEKQEGQQQPGQQGQEGQQQEQGKKGEPGQQSQEKEGKAGQPEKDGQPEEQPGEEKKDDKKSQEDGEKEAEAGKGEPEETAADQAARSIIEEEKDNLARRARIPMGLRPVEKDW